MGSWKKGVVLEPPQLLETRYFLLETKEDMCDVYAAWAEVSSPTCRMMPPTCLGLFDPVDGMLSNFRYDAKKVRKPSSVSLSLTE